MLSEVSSSETANEALDFETRHGLVAESEACFGGTAEDQAELPFDGAVRSEGEDPRPAQKACASSEGGQVVCVFQVFGVHHVANVEQDSEGSG